MRRVAENTSKPAQAERIYLAASNVRDPPMLPFEAKAQRHWSTMRTNTHDHLGWSKAKLQEDLWPLFMSMCSLCHVATFGQKRQVQYAACRHCPLGQWPSRQ